jgi:hypothetical protein
LCGIGAARATDEIAVYTGEVAPSGEVSLEQHLNYPLAARSGTPFPGGLPYRGTLNGTPEMAIGVTDFYEIGLYAPFAAREDRFYPGGFKLRNLFVTPNVEPGRPYFGLNTEISWQPLRFTDSTWNLEFRPILGIRFGRFEFATNPIVDVGLGGQAGNAFRPANRISYAVTETVAIAAETYSDFGPIGAFYGPRQQSHYLFAVLDLVIGPFTLELGLGRGLTANSDPWVAKAIFGRPF